MIPREKISSVFKNSPADKARLHPGDLTGLLPGDVILVYGKYTCPTHRQMLEVSREMLGSGTDITVQRKNEKGVDEPLSPMHVTPTSKNDSALLGFEPAADLEHTVVADVIDSSPAAKAHVERGAKITAVNDIPVKTWGQIYSALCHEKGKPITLHYLIRDNKTVQSRELGVLTVDEFNPDAYVFRVTGPGFPWAPKTVHIKQDGPISAIAWGAKQTLTQVLGTYVSLRSMATGTASVRNAAGPIGIAIASVKMARQSFMDFVWLFAFLNAAIAVFNFLPLPVVDGGLAVFLIIEKIRGKPVSVKVMNVVQYVGLALIGSLFILITINDILRQVNSW